MANRYSRSFRASATPAGPGRGAGARPHPATSPEGNKTRLVYVVAAVTAAPAPPPFRKRLCGAQACAAAGGFTPTDRGLGHGSRSCGASEWAPGESCWCKYEQRLCQYTGSRHDRHWRARSGSMTGRLRPSMLQATTEKRNTLIAPLVVCARWRVAVCLLVLLLRRRS